MSLVETSFQQDAGLGSSTAILSKTEPITAWALQGTDFLNFGKFSARYHCYSFCIGGCNFTEDELFGIYR